MGARPCGSAGLACLDVPRLRLPEPDRLIFAKDFEEIKPELSHTP